MKRFCLILILAVVLASFSSAPVMASETPNNNIPEDIMPTVEKGISMYKTVVKRDLNKWGFASKEEVDQVALIEGFEVVFLEGEMPTAPESASILELSRDDIKYPEWIFSLGINGKTRNLLTVAKMDVNSYECVGFGGDAVSFEHAREAFREFAGDTVKPVLLTLATQYFLMASKDSQEYIIPVPYDQESDTKVVSGNGVVTSTELIAAIHNHYLEFKDMYPDPDNIPMGGEPIIIDVWDVNSNDIKADNSTTSLIFISIISVFAAAAVTILLLLLRKKRIKQQ